MNALITFACCTVFICILEAEAAPISKTEVIRYLKNYDYLRQTSETVISEDILSDAISRFQSFAGINVTGVMDVATTEQMQKPRCGNTDLMVGDETPQNLHDEEDDNQDPADICEDPHVDTIFYLPEEDSIFVFKGMHYWRLTKGGRIADGYPKLIATKWKGLSGDIDAAFAYYKKTYFIKGSDYWTYNGDEVDPGCPRSISDFPGVPVDIDTAWVRNDLGNFNGHFVYFSKGKEIWVLNDPVHKPRLDGNFEKELRSIEGFPNDLDAALAYDGKTFLFKGDDYYLIEGKKLGVSQGYPRKTSLDWFGCPLVNEEKNQRS